MSERQHGDSLGPLDQSGEGVRAPGLCDVCGERPGVRLDPEDGLLCEECAMAEPEALE